MADEEQEVEDIYGDFTDEAVNLYNAATDEQGRGNYFNNLEPDPERWSQIISHPRFNDDMRQLDDLMREYDHVIELQVGEDSFEQVHINNQAIPNNLNFYIAEDQEEFREDVNHRFFRNVDEERFTVPVGSTLGFRFDSYRDTINVPEDLDHVDVNIPTRAAHLYKQVQRNADYEALVGEDLDLDSLPAYQDPDTGQSIDEYDPSGHIPDF